MTSNLTDSCTTYLACLVGMTKDIDWMTVGAIVLLVARLIKDVPDAYAELHKLYRKRKKRKKLQRKRHDKGKR